MDIEGLKSDVERLACENLSFYEIKSVQPSRLQEMTPALTFPEGNGFVIKVSSALVEPDRTKAIAHELGHLYLKFQGLIEVSSITKTLHPYFTLEINNAISHAFLIKLLKKNYGIDSEFHLNHRRGGMSEIKKNVLTTDMETDQYFGLGVALYDTARTKVFPKRYVSKIAKQNPYVQQAYSASEKYLGKINVKLSKTRQAEIIRMFLALCGYK